jgi:ribonucleoside-diphosphate reductase alpha chain
LCGVTVKKETTAGHAYVIVNGGEEPLEVFVNLGKAGSEKYAVAEAIGRLISMILRMDELGTRRQRLEVVADEMRGIGGDRIASNGTRSIPDAIGKALQEVLNDTKDH